MNEPNCSRRHFLKGNFIAQLFVNKKTVPLATSPTRPMPQDPTPHPGLKQVKNMKNEMALPDLNQALLDTQTLNQLFEDIRQCTKFLEAIPKRGPGHADDSGVSLDEARTLLTNKQVRGIQLRYLYDNAEWWDTLIDMGNGVKLVRMRYDS